MKTLFSILIFLLGCAGSGEGSSPALEGQWVYLDHNRCAMELTIEGPRYELNYICEQVEGELEVQSEVGTYSTDHTDLGIVIITFMPEASSCLDSFPETYSYDMSYDFLDDGSLRLASDGGVFILNRNSYSEENASVHIGCYESGNFVPNESQKQLDLHLAF